MITLTRTIMSIRIKTIPVSPEHAPSIPEMVGKPAPEVNGESNHIPSSITRSVDRQSKITELMRVLQFGDSVLPVGAFSFSNGLESSIQHHLVHDTETLRQFVMTAIRQSASADAIALLSAHRAACAHDMAGVLRADTALFNRKLNEEMRTMTVRMGKKLGELSNRLIHTPLLTDWLEHVEHKETPGTYPVGLGPVVRRTRAARARGLCRTSIRHSEHDPERVVAAHEDASLRRTNHSPRGQHVRGSRVRTRLGSLTRRDGDVLALARHPGCRAREGAHTNVHELTHRGTV